jgi:chromosome segregation ATPase
VERVSQQKRRPDADTEGRLKRKNERLRRELAERERRLAEAAKEIADAKKQIADLERQLTLRSQNSTITSKPPASDGHAGGRNTVLSMSQEGHSRLVPES